MNFFKNNQYLIIISFLILIIKIIYFISFSSVYTDSDQIVLWNTLKDYSQLNFYSLQFYGQAYNFNLEVFLALPFYFMGFNEQISLSLAAIFLSSSPFFFISHLWKNNSNNHLKYIPLIVLAALPGEYHMLTGMARGFTGGIFLSALGIYLYHRKEQKSILYLASILCGLGIFVNPNALLLTPLLALNNQSNFKNYKFYFYSFLGFLTASIAFITNYYFYKSNPEMIIHPSPQMGLSLENFTIIISKLDNYFNHISPLFYKIGWLWIIIILIAIIYFIKSKNTQSTLVFSSIFILIFISFFSNKVSDATNSIFFSGSRMYLSLPLIITFLIKELAEIFTNQKIIKLIFSLLILHFLLHSIAYSFIQKDALSGSKYTVVGVQKIENLKKECNKIKNTIKADYYLALDAKGETLLISYGCQCLIDDFSPSYSVLYERRTWLNDYFKNIKLNQILLIGSEKFMDDFVKSFPLKDEIKFSKINQYYWIQSNLSLIDAKELLKKRLK